jgi:RNase P subunit RPR2
MRAKRVCEVCGGPLGAGIILSVRIAQESREACSSCVVAWCLLEGRRMASSWPAVREEVARIGLRRGGLVAWR